MDKNSLIKIIYDEKKNKAKGVLMPREEKKTEYIPEVVGLSKFQLFIFIIFSILFGAGACSIGVYFSNIETREKIKNKLEKRIFIEETKEIEEQKNYIIIGSYDKIEEAKNIASKIQQTTGKICSVEPKNNTILVYLGPYYSKSLASNEIELINFKTAIKGGLVNEI